MLIAPVRIMLRIAASHRSAVAFIRQQNKAALLSLVLLMVSQRSAVAASYATERDTVHYAGSAYALAALQLCSFLSQQDAAALAALVRLMFLQRSAVAVFLHVQDKAVFITPVRLRSRNARWLRLYRDDNSGGARCAGSDYGLATFGICCSITQGMAALIAPVQLMLSQRAAVAAFMRQ